MAAVKKPSLTVVHKKASSSYLATIYEIWCADLLPHVKEKGVWELLMQAFYSWKVLYEAPSDIAKILQNMPLLVLHKSVRGQYHRPLWYIFPIQHCLNDPSHLQLTESCLV